MEWRITIGRVEKYAVVPENRGSLFYAIHFRWFTTASIRSICHFFIRSVVGRCPLSPIFAVCRAVNRIRQECNRADGNFLMTYEDYPFLAWNPDVTTFCIKTSKFPLMCIPPVKSQAFNATRFGHHCPAFVAPWRDNSWILARYNGGATINH